MDYSPREIRNLEDRIDRERRHYIYCSFEPVPPRHAKLFNIKLDETCTYWLVESKTFIPYDEQKEQQIRYMGRGYLK